MLESVVVPLVFCTKAKAEELIPSAITPAVKVVALAPVKVSVTGVFARAVPVILPVKLMPLVSLLLIVLLARTFTVCPVVKTAPSVILKIPPFRLIAPEVLPKLLSALTDKVPALIVVPPV